MIKNYGFKYPKIDEKKDHILGGLRSVYYKVVNESGNWNNSLVIGETQRKIVDVNGCTNFACLNQKEILFKFLFGIEENNSERFQAVVSGQERDGNDPQNVYTSIRDIGVVEEYKLPFLDGMNFEVYLSPKPMTQNYIDDAKKFKENYEYKHKYVYIPDTPLIEKQRLLLQSLKRSPVGVSVYAWQMGDNGLYTKPQGARDTHFTVLINAKEGEWWEVFDSYPESEGDFIKRLEWNFEFDVAKEICIRKKTEEEKKKLSIIEQILNTIAKLIPLFAFLVRKKIEDKKDDPDMEEMESEVLNQETIMVNYTPTPIESPKFSELNVKFAEAIKTFEGWAPNLRSRRNLNPGNLKYTSYTKSLGAIDKDKDNFCIFKDYDAGFNALCQFIKDAGSDKLKSYHNATIKTFFEAYSDNSLIYAKYVAKQMGINIDTKISQII